MRNTDIEEIFQHIKQLKEEQQNITEPEKEISQVSKMISDSKDISPEDVFEVVEFDTAENSSTLGNENITTCDFCGKIMSLENNLSGLSVMGKNFACENCCQEATNVALERWITSINANLSDIQPIALWLMQEKNKNCLFK
jgi:hypothetical protein